MKYTVHVLHGGVYDLDLCTATASTDRQVQLLLDGADLTGAVSLPQTAGWDAWQHTAVTRKEATANHPLRPFTFPLPSIHGMR